MPRNKEYNREEVLDKAMKLFWKQGFKASSMSHIVETTGLNTASLYKEFGDKNGLFEESLQHYADHVVIHKIQFLVDEPNIKGIRKYLDAIVGGAATKGYMGCLMMKSLVEKKEISSHANNQVSNFCTRLEDLLEVAFRNAIVDGDIPSTKSPAVLASFVTCCVHGLVLYGQHPDKQEGIPKLQDLIWQVLNG